MNENPNRSKVWLVQGDPRRDYSAADEFGEVKEIFSAINRNFDSNAAIGHARRVLQNYSQHDFIVMAGDPALCAICVAVATEESGYCKILKWDKVRLKYSVMELQF